MPILGFGVYQISNEEMTKTVSEAIEAGYRMLDLKHSLFFSHHDPETVEMIINLVR